VGRARRSAARPHHRSHQRKYSERLPGTSVIIKGDQDLIYGDVKAVINEIRKSGAPGVSLAASTPKANSHGDEQRHDSEHQRHAARRRRCSCSSSSSWWSAVAEKEMPVRVPDLEQQDVPPLTFRPTKSSCRSAQRPDLREPEVVTKDNLLDRLTLANNAAPTRPFSSMPMIRPPMASRRSPRHHQTSRYGNGRHDDARSVSARAPGAPPTAPQK